MDLTKYYGRVKGQSKTHRVDPHVILESYTRNPCGTLFSLWHGSRNNERIPAYKAQALYDGDVSDVELQNYICECYPEHAGENGDDYKNVIKQIAKMNLIANVPSAECVQFVFCIDNATVALRDQMVRSKLASYWTQTSRTADLRTMNVNMAQSVIDAGPEAVEIYTNVVDVIRRGISELADMGVPIEDIRLTPDSMTHRVYWMISARALLPILTKRTSWIAQATLWSSIVSQVAKLVSDVDPMFKEFYGKVEGVEFGDGDVTFYKYINECDDRYEGRDPQPCDPLYLAHLGRCMPEHTNIEFYDRMKRLYINLWNDDILSILGWDRSNPETIGYYDRPYSWFKENNRLDVIKGLKLEDGSVVE